MKNGQGRRGRKVVEHGVTGHSRSDGVSYRTCVSRFQRKLNRPAFERIHQIHARIRDGAYPNCVELAAEMEISVATVKRDVQFMKDRLRLPIEYDPRRHGFYFSGPSGALPGTAAELSE